MKHWQNTNAELREFNKPFYSKATNKTDSYLIKLQPGFEKSFSFLQHPYLWKMGTIHLLISGKVQGVFFRETSRQLAEKLHITGWIKNTIDGKVEALVSGDEKALNDFLNFCKAGPERAVVDEVKVTKQQKMDFEKFEIIKRK